MKKPFTPGLPRVRAFARTLACCLMAGTVILNGGKSYGDITGPGNGNAVFFSSSGGMVVSVNGSTAVATAGIVINGKDIGSILEDAFDLNHDGKVTLDELKQVADASFKLWDTNNDGYLSQGELSTGLGQLFPAPPTVGMMAFNGVAVQVPADQMPTPAKQVTKHLFAAADTNKDGLLSLQELNDYLDKNFSQWDQNGDGSLSAQELAVVFAQFAMPDLPPPQ
jgi:Ca2+-binding EF-hand superfamily protein